MTSSLIAVIIVGLLFMAFVSLALMPFFPTFARLMRAAPDSKKDDEESSAS